MGEDWVGERVSMPGPIYCPGDFSITTRAKQTDPSKMLKSAFERQSDLAIITVMQTTKYRIADHGSNFS